MTHLSDARLYFTVSWLHNADLDGLDKEYYSQLLKIWRRFMAGPPKLQGMDVTQEFYGNFRKLEAIANERYTLRKQGRK